MRTAARALRSLVTAVLCVVAVLFVSLLMAVVLVALNGAGFLSTYFTCVLVLSTTVAWMAAYEDEEESDEWRS